MILDAIAAVIWAFLLFCDLAEEKHQHSTQLILAHAVLVLCFIRLAMMGG